MNSTTKLKELFSSPLLRMRELDITRRQLLMGLTLTFLLIVFGFVVLNSGPLAPTKVTTIKVSDQSLAPTLFGVGTIEARRSYLMGPVVAGRVLNVYVDVGYSVKEGQLLAEMDSIDLTEKMIAVQAQVSDAKARLLLAS